MSAHWSERREGGSRFAQRLLCAIGLRLGRPAARLFLYPITLYFFFRRGPERQQSRAFLSRALGRPAPTWAVLKHLHCYAATILDRVFLLSDSRFSESSRRFDIRVHGLDQLETQMAHARGVLLLGAHIGSFEVMRTLAVERPDVQVRVVMDTQQTPAMTAMLHALNPAVAAGVIDAGQDGTAVALAIQDAAKQGALIGLLADRARPREPTRDATFFGDPAPFPIAPYLIASVLKLPVVLCFGLFRGGNRYDLYFETFAECIQIARSERAAKLGEWTQRYAARLEHYTRMDPFNWFNFYDFWHRFDDAHAAVGDSVSARSAA
jgi:predicted LPLAT superfamily acyltransferase